MGNHEEEAQALLAVLASATGPIGTRSARLALGEMGIALSESSVSRLLRELDSRGWSVPFGAKGRVLTLEGQQLQAQFELSHQTSASLGAAVDVRDVKDLLDLLHARKAVESAAAGDTAVHATPADIRQLQELVGHHRSSVGTASMWDQPGLRLHRKIAAIAPNRMLKILTGLVLAPHLDRVEAVLDIALGTQDDQDRVVEDHQQIVDLIAAHDSAGAEAAMNDHFVKMIGAAGRYAARGDASIMSRLLQWMDAAGHRPQS